MTEPADHTMSEVSWAEVAAAVFRARGIKSGLWRFAVKLQFAGTTLGWQPSDGITQHRPSALVGVDSFAMFPATEPGPMVFDAAEGIATPPETKHTAKAKSRSRVKA